MHMLRHLPNALTLLRIALVPPFALALHAGRFDLALGLFFVAGLSDAIDGFLARQFDWHSRFGAIADPIADKLLLITGYVMLAWGGQIPVWLAATVLGRDLVIVLGALGYHFLISRYEIHPSLWGKLCTLVQILFVLLVIADRAGLGLAPAIVQGAEVVVLLTTLFSGAHYAVVWGHRAFRLRRG
jgi:cardiolipin synthase